MASELHFQPAARSQVNARITHQTPTAMLKKYSNMKLRVQSVLSVPCEIIDFSVSPDSPMFMDLQLMSLEVSAPRR